MDKDYLFIRRFDTTTVSVHDSQIDLSQKGETVYRDKGYFGTVPFASINKTMHRAIGGWELSKKNRRRNRAISRTRSLVERPLTVIKKCSTQGIRGVLPISASMPKISSPVSATIFSPSSIFRPLSGSFRIPRKKKRSDITGF